eukprot:CAMPEP_0203754968 /NCGR_PEP_ID=MMETSP0098-20131031/8504_1 /ASSEMBLY_ACC=CAM_ASM_000208 /TAXON_ID=96639 /ORGANISM=" , Strain NY0313808BC1" /LENGTH=473 /DNA_ID=CAMNT_0050646241 /DNA_START=1144 /DNA_END=2561 /DNA_ORIENTATION=+
MTTNYACPPSHKHAARNPRLANKMGCKRMLQTTLLVVMGTLSVYTYFALISMVAPTAPKTRSGVPLVIMEQHGDAVNYWSKLVHTKSDGPVLLVHVDSYSDMMELPIPDYKQGDDLTAKLPEPGMGDFVTLALFTDLVTNVVWIRSDFSEGSYNGPPPGAWETNISYFEVSSTELSVCFDGLAMLPGAKSQGLNNTNYIEAFETCTMYPEEGLISQRSMRVLVRTAAEDSLSPETHVEETKNWILDIDLDYFAATDPGLEIFRQYGFSKEWVDEYFQGAFECNDSNYIEDLAHTDQQYEDKIKALKKVMNMLLETDDTTANKVILNTFVENKVSCSISNTSKVHTLVRQVQAFTAEQRANWTKIWDLDIADWTGDMMEVFFSQQAAYGPLSLHNSREDIVKRVQQLSYTLAAYVQTFGWPECITLARSSKYDHVVPSERVDEIQQQVVDMLRTLVPIAAPEIYNYDAISLHPR